MDDWLKKYLFDIKDSIDSITAYLDDNPSFDEYNRNKMLRRSIERELEIIGEAMNKIEKIDPEIGISGKKQIIGLRNRVIHNYDNIDNEIVWGILVKYLPLLRSEVKKLIGE